MRQCRLRALLLLASLVWSNLGMAQGQDAPAHSPLRNPGPAAINPLDRLTNLQMLRDLDPKQIEILQKLLGKSSLESVNFDEVWEKLDSLEGGAPGAAKGRAFDQRLESLLGTKEENQAPPFLNDLRDFAKKLIPNELSAKFKGARASTPDGTALQPSAPAPSPPPPFADAAPAGQDRLEGKQLARWMMNMAERMKDERSVWNQSPALQNALKDFSLLTAKAMADGPASTWDDDSASIALQNLSRFLTPGDKASGGETPPAGAWPMPSLGNVKMSAPKFGPVFKDLQNSMPGGLGISIRPGMIEGCVGGVLAVAILMLLFSWRRRKTARDRAVWRLGPWPVNPARIRSSKELITAFEYLALCDRGREAYSWNHRAVADSLGKSGGRRQEAADDLAFLYERARYAPAAGPLTENQIREARRNLCFLAGVSRA